MAENTVQHVSSIPVPTSKYVADSSVFYSGRKAALLVLVEDEDDIHFWRRLFSCVSSRYRSVDIYSLRTASATVLAQTDANSKTMDATGKDSLMKVTGLGMNKVVAVDADYDLLFDYHTYSQRVREDRYVIHTEYYSIENHLLDKAVIPSLSIWQGLADNVPEIDWNALYEQLASAISGALKLCVASMMHRQKLYEEGVADLPQTLKVKDIRAAFGKLNFHPDNSVDDLSAWQSSFESTDTFRKLREECHEELDALDCWTSEDILHNLQGHTLFEYVNKALEWYFEQGRKCLLSKEMSGLADKSKAQDIIGRLNRSLGLDGMSKGQLVKSSVYDASALDLSDEALSRIQERIQVMACAGKM